MNTWSRTSTRWNTTMLPLGEGVLRNGGVWLDLSGYQIEAFLICMAFVIAGIVCVVAKLINIKKLKTKHTYWTPEWTSECICIDNNDSDENKIIWSCYGNENSKYQN